MKFWEFAREEMESREWSEGYFATLIGWTIDQVRAFYRGDMPMTPRLAVMLAVTFGVSAVFWRRLAGVPESCNFPLA